MKLSASPTPPSLRGLVWRAVESTDFPRLAHLEQAISSLDGDGAVSLVAPIKHLLAGEHGPGHTICAFDATHQQIVACAWLRLSIEPHECRIMTGGGVHPAWRRQRLGRFLLAWTEAHARTLQPLCPEDRATVLRIDRAAVPAEAAALYQQMGYSWRFTVLQMTRDLNAPLPIVSRPPTITLSPWETARASDFYQTYTAAFRERPGFPGWSEAQWVTWISSGDGFRPDLTLLALDQERPLGFVTCDVESTDTGWINQVGVTPAARGRGIGAILLTEVMRRLHAERYAALALEVNNDNPKAIRLYQQLGFEVSGQRTLYSRALP